MVYNLKILHIVTCALVETGLQFYVYNLYLNTTNAQDDSAGRRSRLPQVSLHSRFDTPQ